MKKCPYCSNVVNPTEITMNRVEESLDKIGYDNKKGILDYIRVLLQYGFYIKTGGQNG